MMDSLNARLRSPSTRTRSALKAAGLLGSVRRLYRGARYGYRLLTGWEHRQRAAEKRQFDQFLRRYTNLMEGPQRFPPTTEKALIIGRGPAGAIEGHLMLAKVLKMAGYRPVILLSTEDQLMRKYYELAGISDIHLWNPWDQSARYVGEAEAMLSRCQSLRTLLKVEYNGVRVGRSAISTTLRRSQLGSLKVGRGSHDRLLIHWLAAAMAAAAAAGRAVEQIRPALVASGPMEYFPRREVFDACVARGIKVIVSSPAHKSSVLILRRYTAANREQHPSSLSETSWNLIRQMPWTKERRQELRNEIEQCYARGNWWGIPSEQVNKNALLPNEIRQQLLLDPEKKTVFIFAHVPWDASFCWGDDLFEDYQEWLLETVRIAYDKPQVNWVVKIHPANIGKTEKRAEGADPIEHSAIRQHFGKLPRHVVVLPADSAIGTISLFGVMDYCLTVRGTVGIEAASLGIPVLTAGTGRYDRKGFTIDSTSTAQYLERVRNIHQIPSLTDVERELAERFAYGLFLLRPLARNTVTLDETTKNGEWCDPGDLQALLGWLRDSDSEDFMMPLPR